MKVVRLYKDSKFPTEPCDLVVCKAYPHTLTKEQLAFPSIGCINIHTSLLPKYRGRHPIVWAMINCEPVIGVTLHWMTAGIDEGDIINQKAIPLSVNDRYADVKAKLDDAGEQLLRGYLCNPELYTRYAQDESKATSWPRRRPSDSHMLPSLMKLMSAKEITAFINAHSDPMPNAFIEDAYGHKVYFKEARYEKRRL